MDYATMPVGNAALVSRFRTCYQGGVGRVC